MSLAIDGSSPAAVTSAAAVTTLTTGAFTPPAGALLLVSVTSHYMGAATTAAITTVTGSTSAWTKAIEQSSTNSSEDGWFWATVTSAVSTTIRATWSNSSSATLKVFVLTGAATVPVGVALADKWFGGNTSQTLSYTATAIGSIGFFNAHDDQVSPVLSFGSCTSDVTLGGTNQAAVAHQTTPAAALVTQSFVCAMPSDSDGYSYVEIRPGVASPTGFTGWGIPL